LVTLLAGKPLRSAWLTNELLVALGVVELTK
jgi:hypothetical protein